MNLGNIKVRAKAEGLDNMEKLIHEADEKMKELEKIFEAINSAEIKITVQLPEKKEE